MSSLSTNIILTILCDCNRITEVMTLMSIATKAEVVMVLVMMMTAEEDERCLSNNYRAEVKLFHELK